MDVEHIQSVRPTSSRCYPVLSLLSPMWFFFAFDKDRRDIFFVKIT